jgi:hypothetical protein
LHIEGRLCQTFPKSGKRAAAIFSEFDLCASMAGIANYRSLGYKPDDRRQRAGVRDGGLTRSGRVRN